MKVKEIDQFMCDYYKDGEEIAVDAKWLQSKLMEIESMKHAIKTLNHNNDLLQSLSVLRDYDCPQYRLNIKG